MDESALVQFYRNLDRSFFLEDEYKGLAHHDSPLPIGYQQTISQPSLVLEMTKILSPEKTDKVLEIGTGSGYQTTLLAHFSKSVYTIERIDALSIKAQSRLKALKYDNVHFKTGDGSKGWIEHAPYDKIMVTAAAGKIPKDLIDQLACEGKMLIPVGPRYVQRLVLVSKDDKGDISKKSLLSVRFVELVGTYDDDY